MKDPKLGKNEEYDKAVRLLEAFDYVFTRLDHDDDSVYTSPETSCYMREGDDLKHAVEDIINCNDGAAEKLYDMLFPDGLELTSMSHPNMEAVELKILDNISEPWCTREEVGELINQIHALNELNRSLFKELIALKEGQYKPKAIETSWLD